MSNSHKHLTTQERATLRHRTSVSQRGDYHSAARRQVLVAVGVCQRQRYRQTSNRTNTRAIHRIINWPMIPGTAQASKPSDLQAMILCSGIAAYGGRTCWTPPLNQLNPCRPLLHAGQAPSLRFDRHRTAPRRPPATVIAITCSHHDFASPSTANRTRNAQRQAGAGLKPEPAKRPHPGP